MYIRESGIGLKHLVKGELKLVKNGKQFAQVGVVFMLELRGKQILVGSYQKGLFIYDGENLYSFDTEIDKYLLENKPYNGIKLTDGKIAIATLRGGVAIITTNGKLHRLYNESDALKDNDVKNLYQDKQDNIWLATNNGISKIEYSSPFSFYDKRKNIDGIILSVAIQDNELYAGTTSGLFRLESFSENRIDKILFNKIPDINENVWDLALSAGNLFSATNRGIYKIDYNSVKIISTEPAYKMYTLKENKDNILLGTRQGLKVLFKDRGNWISRQIFDKLKDEIRTIVEEGNGELWLGTLSSGAIKINDIYNAIDIKFMSSENELLEKNFISRFDTTDGLPKGEVNIFEVNNRPFFATAEGLYRFDSITNKFIPDSTFGSEFAGGNRGVFRLKEDDNGDVWIHSLRRNFLAKKQSGGKFNIHKKTFMRLPDVQVNVIYPFGNEVWFGTYDELIRYDKKNKKEFDMDFNALIRGVLINNDSTIYGGYASEDYISPILNYKNRNLRFEYACPFFEAEEKTEFQYKLEGYDEDWSEWTKETKKDYTNLSEGSYTFNVRAKNVYGDLSKTAVYSFEVLPPYYRTVWAYIIYSFLFVSFGFVIVKWRINKLEKEKENLERIVDEKTKEVKEQSEKLKELDKIKSRFFANISHEFRTPLTLIIGPAEQMLTEEKSKEKKNKFSLMLRNSKKLLGLINQLLDLSKLESGKIKLRARKINLNRLVKEVVSLFYSLAAQKKIDLKFYSKEEEINLYCDTDKIEKIVVNLISNALKFTKKNGEINVTVLKEEKQSREYPSGYAQLVVEDTGIGISGGNLKNIFDPFYQVDPSIKREYEGTGIGLALAKEYIELHKGTINTTSVIGKGTKFEIKLSLGKEHLQSADIIENEEAYQAVVSDISLLKTEFELEEDHSFTDNYEQTEEGDDRFSILVVEDNKDVRSYIREHLDNDYKIIEAEDGKRGLIKANEIIPDLIISDVMMPEMDGFEFCKEIKTDINTSHIPVILLTAKSGDENIIHGLDTGADDYITKPFNVQILLTRVKNLIELRQQLHKKFQREAILQPSEFKVTSMDDRFLMKFHKLVEKNYTEPDLNIENFIENFNMSRASLFRKIKALTGDTPNNYLRSYRLKRAAQLIKQKGGNVTEIAFAVGFSSSAYFTKCFKEKFNQLPTEYQA